MTITYDPNHPKYLDEKDVRDELTRVYDLCHGCRLCFKYCTAFPTLFDFIDRHDDQDGLREQDRQRAAAPARPGGTDQRGVLGRGVLGREAVGGAVGGGG